MKNFHIFGNPLIRRERKLWNLREEFSNSCMEDKAVRIQHRNGKESACNAGHLGSIPGLGKSPGEGKIYPFQYSGQENSTDCIVHEVAKLDMTEQLSLIENFPP